jgi:hypothetical protein
VSAKELLAVDRRHQGGGVGHHHAGGRGGVDAAGLLVGDGLLLVGARRAAFALAPLAQVLADQRGRRAAVVQALRDGACQFGLAGALRAHERDDAAGRQARRHARTARVAAPGMRCRHAR